MSTVKINLTLDEATAAFLKERAARVREPTSRYVTELTEADRQRYEDELAEEGYRLLSADAASFAEAALPLANEGWSKWEPERGKFRCRKATFHEGEGGLYRDTGIQD